MGRTLRQIIGAWAKNWGENLKESQLFLLNLEKKQKKCHSAKNTKLCPQAMTGRL